MSVTVLPQGFTEERNRVLLYDLSRRRALDRLYERRAVIDDLIRSLEKYERTGANRAECIPFSAPPKYS
jgi:hypothetical protein